MQELVQRDGEEPPSRLARQPRYSANPEISDVAVLSAIAFTTMAGTSALCTVLGLGSVVALSLSIAISPFVLIGFASRAVQRAARIQIDVTQAVAERRLDDAQRALAGPGRMSRLTVAARVQLIYAQANLAAGEGRWDDALQLHRSLHEGSTIRRWRKQFLPAWTGITGSHCIVATFAGELEEAQTLLELLHEAGDAGLRSRQASIEIPLAVRRGEVDRALAVLDNERRNLDYAMSRAGFLELAFLIDFGLRARSHDYRTREAIDPGGVALAARRGDFDYLCTHWPELGEYLTHRRSMSARI